MDLARNPPKNILDLGCGRGEYGEMIRKYLPRETRLVGLDGYMPYLNSNECRVYDILIKADVFDVVGGRLSIPFDCVLCMDVVEHFPKDRAKGLLGWLVAQVRSYMSTPLFWLEQDESYGNVLEKHQCWFQEEELLGMGWELVSKVQWDERGLVGSFRNGSILR